MSELEHKRILLKFSGESVAGNDEHGIDPKILDNMADSVKSCKEVGAEIGIVIGGGNLFRGENLMKQAWIELPEITWVCWQQL